MGSLSSSRAIKLRIIKIDFESNVLWKDFKSFESCVWTMHLYIVKWGGGESFEQLFG